MSYRRYHPSQAMCYFTFLFFFICIYYTSNSIGALHRGIISVDSFSMFHPKSPAVHREREKYWEITARSWKTNSGEDGFPNCFYIHLQCIYMDIKFGYLPVAFQWSLKSVFIDQWLSQLSLFFSISGSSPFNIKPPSFYFLNFFFTLIES